MSPSQTPLALNANIFNEFIFFGAQIRNSTTNFDNWNITVNNDGKGAVGMVYFGQYGNQIDLILTTLSLFGLSHPK